MKTNDASTERRLLTRHEVEKILGIGKSTIYRLVADGRIPPPVVYSGRAVRWVSTEIDEVLARMIAKRDAA